MILKLANRDGIDQLIMNTVDNQLVEDMLPKSKDSNAQEVFEYLAQNYPEDTLSWVQNAKWTKGNIQLSDIQMSRRPGGAREQDKVSGIAKAIKSGEEMEPVVLVKVPGKDKYKIADGYHRTLAFEHAGKDKLEAWIGEVEDKNGPWDKEMHERKLNIGKKANFEEVLLLKEAALPAVLGRGALKLGKGLAQSTLNAGKSLSGMNVAKTQIAKNKVLKNPNATVKEIKGAKKDARKAIAGSAGSWGALGIAGAGAKAAENFNEERQEKYQNAIEQPDTYKPFRNQLNP